MEEDSDEFKKETSGSLASSPTLAVRCNTVWSLVVVAVALAVFVVPVISLDRGPPNKSTGIGDMSMIP